MRASIPPLLALSCCLSDGLEVERAVMTMGPCEQLWNDCPNRKG